MKLCGFDVGLDQPFFLIAGPCVIESEQLQMDVAGELKAITAELGIPFIFKSSYDKANRSSGSTFRGPGMDKGLEILAKVRRELAFKLQTKAFGSLLADAWHFDQAPGFLQRHRLGQIAHAHTRENGQGSARPHAGNLDQLAKRLALRS